MAKKMIDDIIQAEIESREVVERAKGKADITVKAAEDQANEIRRAATITGAKMVNEAIGCANIDAKKIENDAINAAKQSCRDMANKADKVRQLCKEKIFKAISG